MTYILNIETATSVCSVSLAQDGKIVDCIENNKDQTHAELLTVFIEQLFEQNNLTAKDLLAVAVSSGPGSYTGLRIGVSVAKGICYARRIPLISVSTLEAMAWGAVQAHNDKGVLLCPMIDARRMEVYSSVFDADLKMVEETKAVIIDEDSYQDHLQNRVLFFGTGAQKCEPVITNLNAVFLEDFFISSKYMSQLSYQKFQQSVFEDVAYYEPFYLKEFQAIKFQKNFLA